MVGVLEESLSNTLANLGHLGCLAPGDEAFVALCMVTARALDEDPGNPPLLREYRAMLLMLDAKRPPTVDDEQARFLAEVSLPRAGR
jgi:hypothetical protein